MRSAMFLLCTSLVFLGCGGDSSGVTYPGQAATSVVLTLSPVGELASAGDTRGVTAVVKAADQSVVPSPTLTWTTDAPTVATVRGAGDKATITAVGDGVATITATTGSVAGTVTVTVRRKLASVVLTNPTPLLGIGTTAQLVATEAARLYDEDKPCGPEANAAKYLGSEAAFEVCDRAMQTHGGFAYAKEYHIERLWRESRLLKIAPVSQEMVCNFIAQKVLGLPKSY